MEHETREEFKRIQTQINQQLNRKRLKYLGLTVEEVNSDEDDSDVDLDRLDSRKL